jgi:hypothetical protein
MDPGYRATVLLGSVWHLPNDPNTHTTRQLVDLVFQQASRPRTRRRQVKPLLIRLAALTTAARTWSTSWPRRANDEQPGDGGAVSRAQSPASVGQAARDGPA